MSSKPDQRERIGYWRSDVPPLQPDLPDPRQLVDEGWPLRERVRLAKYLRRGQLVASWQGYSWCRFECGMPMRMLGTRDLGDDHFVWPEGLHHYVEAHAVRLPQRFLDHVADRLPSLEPWWRAGVWWRRRKVAVAMKAEQAQARVDAARRTEEALHEAARDGDAKQVRALLAAGYSVDGRDSYGMTALALTRRLSVAKILLEAGAAIDPQPPGYITPLQQAVVADDRQWLSYLLEQGADINALDKLERSVLSYSKPSMVALLLERGADAKLGAPLYNAAAHGDIEMIERLLEAGADIDDGIGSVAPLLSAARSDKGDAAVKRLLEAGADVSATNDMGHSALMHAAERMSLTAVRKLVEAGAPLDVHGERGVNVLHMAAIAKGKPGDRSELLAFLLSQPAAAALIDVRDEWGRTPLACAAIYAGEAEMRVLLDAGADPTIANDDGLTPAELAQPAPPGKIQGTDRSE